MSVSMSSDWGDTDRGTPTLNAIPDPILGNGIPIEVVTTNVVDFSKYNTTKKKPTNLLDTDFRAIHKVRSDRLAHNFNAVESAAARQRCSVMVVVKADGYGHGSINTALYLADFCGADAFAVATLGEGIALRHAFNTTRPGQHFAHDNTLPIKLAGSERKSTKGNGATPSGASRFFSSVFAGAGAGGGVEKNILSLFAPGPSDRSIAAANDTGSTRTTTTSGTTESSSSASKTKTIPGAKVQQDAGSVGTCDYSFGIAAGKPIPSPLPRSTSKIASRPKQIRIVVLGSPVGYPRCFDDYYHYGIEVMVSGPEVAKSLLNWVNDSASRTMCQIEKVANETKARALRLDEEEEADDSDHSPAETRGLSATLGNVSGRDLAKEIRKLLMNQEAAKHKKEQPLHSRGNSSNGAVASGESTSGAAKLQRSSSSTSSGSAPKPKGQLFSGIEAAAKNSRTRERNSVRAHEVFHEDSAEDGSSFGSRSVNTVTVSNTPRKTLRWHALVDSGMGRLGFKTQPVSKEDSGMRRDTVDIIQELVDMEMQNGSPIEFYGMHTHMADATNSNATYTHEQIGRFKSLLKRVRAAGISIPTISTDNSAALLDKTLTHFNPTELLSQPNIGTPSRGYVRIGGAIFGQRPAFKQLKATSTLLASVRHIATLRKGESVGYDRAYIAPFNVRIATLTIGFADGFPRELGNGVGKVEIRSHVFPIAGNVCMDMIMVELGPAEQKTGVAAEIVVGDTAVLWGPLNEEDGEGLVLLADIARTLKTTQSALTCGLNKDRVLRTHI